MLQQLLSKASELDLEEACRLRDDLAELLAHVAVSIEYAKRQNVSFSTALEFHKGLEESAESIPTLG